VGKRLPGFKANHAVAKKLGREITHTGSTERGEQTQWRSTLLAHAAMIVMLVGVIIPQAHAQSPVGAYANVLSGTMSEVSSKLAIIYNLDQCLRKGRNW